MKWILIVYVLIGVPDSPSLIRYEPGVMTVDKEACERLGEKIWFGVKFGDGRIVAWECIQ